MNEKTVQTERSARLSSRLKELLRVEWTSWKFTLLTAVIITLFSISYVQYVMASWGIYGFSFDDSWIHVQYARTIFEGRAWEYAWGIPSTGSSGPLWSVVLSPIFLFGYDHDTVVTAVLAISGILYIIDVFLVGEIVKQHTEKWELAILGQIIFVLVPRNAGLMLSGMETPLGMMMILLSLLFLPRQEWQYDIILGLVVGLAYLCRPEFVLIAALCLPIRSLIGLYRDDNRKRRLLTLSAMFALAVLVVLPWILHCYNTTGLPLPDSYYSKLRWGVDQGGFDLWNWFWLRTWFPSEPYLSLGFVGGVVILVAKRRPYELVLISSLYALYYLTMPGMSFLFAARYLVPLFDLMAIAFISGLALVLEAGLIRVSKSSNPGDKDVIFITAAVIFLLFTPSLISSVGYVEHHANQAKNIEEMQVHLALWIRDNIPENATIATYDVGALGFFARGTVLDTYGLVTPLLLHNYTNAYSQSEFLRDVNCTYIMYYVEWFPYFRHAITNVGGAVTELYTVHLDDPVVVGTPNMAVYHIQW
ncbi:MAG: hypothetical protein ACFFFO_12715 [Candidatus Thorarchaeota archaeon]